MALMDAITWVASAIFTSAVSGVGFYCLALAADSIKVYYRDKRRRERERLALEFPKFLSHLDWRDGRIGAGRADYGGMWRGMGETTPIRPKHPDELSKGAAMFAAYRMSPAFLSCTAKPRSRTSIVRHDSTSYDQHAMYNNSCASAGVAGVAGVGSGFGSGAVAGRGSDGGIYSDSGSCCSSNTRSSLLRRPSMASAQTSTWSASIQEMCASKTWDKEDLCSRCHAQIEESDSSSSRTLNSCTNMGISSMHQNECSPFGVDGANRLLTRNNYGIPTVNSIDNDAKNSDLEIVSPELCISKLKPSVSKSVDGDRVHPEDDSTTMPCLNDSTAMRNDRALRRVQSIFHEQMLTRASKEFPFAYPFLEQGKTSSKSGGGIRSGNRNLENKRRYVVTHTSWIQFQESWMTQETHGRSQPTPRRKLRTPQAKIPLKNVRDAIAMAKANRAVSTKQLRKGKRTSIPPASRPTGCISKSSQSLNPSKIGTKLKDAQLKKEDPRSNLLQTPKPLNSEGTLQCPKPLKREATIQPKALKREATLPLKQLRREATMQPTSFRKEGTLQSPNPLKRQATLPLRSLKREGTLLQPPKPIKREATLPLRPPKIEGISLQPPKALKREETKKNLLLQKPLKREGTLHIPKPIKREETNKNLREPQNSAKREGTLQPPKLLKRDETHKNMPVIQKPLKKEGTRKSMLQPPKPLKRDETNQIMQELSRTMNWEDKNNTLQNSPKMKQKIGIDAIKNNIEKEEVTKQYYRSSSQLNKDDSIQYSIQKEITGKNIMLRSPEIESEIVIEPINEPEPRYFDYEDKNNSPIYYHSSFEIKSQTSFKIDISPTRPNSITDPRTKEQSSQEFPAFTGFGDTILPLDDLIAIQEQMIVLAETREAKAASQQRPADEGKKKKLPNPLRKTNTIVGKLRKEPTFNITSKSKSPERDNRKIEAVTNTLRKAPKVKTVSKSKSPERSCRQTVCIQTKDKRQSQHRTGSHKEDDGDEKIIKKEPKTKRVSKSKSPKKIRTKSNRMGLVTKARGGLRSKSPEKKELPNQVPRTCRTTKNKSRKQPSNVRQVLTINVQPKNPDLEGNIGIDLPVRSKKRSVLKSSDRNSRFDAGEGKHVKVISPVKEVQYTDPPDISNKNKKKPTAKRSKTESMPSVLASKASSDLIGTDNEKVKKTKMIKNASKQKAKLKGQSPTHKAVSFSNDERTEDAPKLLDHKPPRSPTPTYKSYVYVTEKDGNKSVNPDKSPGSLVGKMDAVDNNKLCLLRKSALDDVVRQMNIGSNPPLGTTNTSLRFVVPVCRTVTSNHSLSTSFVNPYTFSASAISQNVPVKPSSGHSNLDRVFGENASFTLQDFSSLVAGGGY